jgi:hypothetical protein
MSAFGAASKLPVTLTGVGPTVTFVDSMFEIHELVAMAAPDETKTINSQIGTILRIFFLKILVAKIFPPPSYRPMSANTLLSIKTVFGNTEQVLYTHCTHFLLRACSLRKKPVRLTLLLVGLILLAGLFLSTLQAKVTEQPTQPIKISYKLNFGNVGIEVLDTVSIAWTNTNSKQSYTGHFQLILEDGKTIANSAVTITYKNSVLVGQKSNNQLIFTLPSQVFSAGKSGTTNFELTYNTMGNYKWSISVISSN